MMLIWCRFSIRNNDYVITDFKFDFVIISLKKHNFTKSLNFRSPKLNVKGVGNFFKFGTKIMHFRHRPIWGVSLATPLLIVYKIKGDGRKFSRGGNAKDQKLAKNSSLPLPGGRGATI